MERHEAQRPRARRRSSTATPRCSRVLYPGLPDHPGHEVQKRQASGFGAMIAFDLGSFDAAKALLDRVRGVQLAESLGGVETLISHPATMTHASMPEAAARGARRRAGLGAVLGGDRGRRGSARRPRPGAAAGAVAFQRPAHMGGPRASGRGTYAKTRLSSVLTGDALDHPAHVSLFDLVRRDGEDLGHLVAVDLADGGRHRLESRLERLDQEQQLRRLA